jgi:hypothetical protein
MQYYPPAAWWLDLCKERVKPFLLQLYCRTQGRTTIGEADDADYQVQKTIFVQHGLDPCGGVFICDRNICPSISAKHGLFVQSYERLF